METLAHHSAPLGRSDPLGRPVRGVRSSGAGLTPRILTGAAVALAASAAIGFAPPARPTWTVPPLAEAALSAELDRAAVRHVQALVASTGVATTLQLQRVVLQLRKARGLCQFGRIERARGAYDSLLGMQIGPAPR